MSIIESLKQTTDKATSQGERYLETTKNYYELKVFQQLTLALSLVCKIALIGGLVFLGLIFTLLAATIALGNYFDDMAVGSILVAIVLVVLALVGYVFRKAMDKQIIKKMASEFFEDKL